MKVLKFGGSSVSCPSRIREVIQIIINCKRDGSAITVVFSAFQGVTDMLIEMANRASSGDNSYLSVFEELRDRHLNTIRELIQIRNQSHILTNTMMSLKELSDILHGVVLIKELSAKTLDLVMSYGERLSAYIISEAIKDVGIDAEYLDSRKLVICDDNYGYGRVNYELTYNNIREYY
ncbi:MAG TPA: hypothetical protein DEO33_03275, partial [Rikenellaceae bacterium]|nr:hypothetical protein [Rikenellaceae bacterium]